MSKYSYLTVFLIAFLSANAQVQNTINKDSTTTNSVIPYKKGEQYILGGISVSGLQKFSEQTIKVYTGLVEGQSIKLPGDKLTSAIKKLYESKQFSEVDVYLSKKDKETVYLLFDVTELPQLTKVSFIGVSKSKAKDLKKETDLKKGAMVTDNLLVTTKNYLKKKYTDKGFLKTKVSLDTKKDTSDVNTVSMNIFVDKGNRVKIKKISFVGNKAITSSALRGVMKNTKRKAFGRFWKSSKYILDDYKSDLENILEKYSEKGYRDARIISDKLTWNEDNTINLEIALEEGRQYRFAEIKFIGNKNYSNTFLEKFLRIDKGDVYNGKVLKERISGDGTPSSQDIQTLYHNNGYLFSQINAVETKVKNDSITVEVRIREDEQATIKKVTVTGNEKTNDHVIYRELRVKPGDLFSRENIIRSIREIGQLGFFDANVSPDVKPDYQNKTADIDFAVVEKGGSQVELQGGYGGGSFIGTLGLSFNNFSIRNILNKEAYKPLPMGDGQKLALRLQASRTYNTYSFSFTEPWLGGKKPQALSFSVYLSNQYQFDYNTNTVSKDRSLSILGASIGLSKRLQWPDDYFSLSQNLSYQRIKLDKYGYRVGSSNDIIDQGTLNNLAYTVAFSRNSTGPSLIFPSYGSEFTVKAKATLPYSLINGKDYIEPIYPTDDERRDYLADKYKWLEYYKISAKGKWYTSLSKNNKLVLMSNFEMGYLGTYNKKLGLTPVERYFVGGDGIAQGQLDGRETVGLRGYENNSLSVGEDGQNEGGSIYNKFQMEVRYSITDKPSASIYTLGFLEAGNSYNSFSEFNPFKIKRSAGVGLRIFMPAFGLLGIDFAHGFDPLPGLTEKSGWQTHFIIGRQF
ncbi:outer membrane protein assembly factor BamA [Tenacibaculum aestuariivivum]|uniref:outer membrane protein assembly factor BamA n=1 Tax=Tenacibaculum aestuariivivum TaxID=2006131 RepID=UPI003AB7DA50